MLSRVQPQDPTLTSPLLENSLVNCLPRDARLLGTETPSKNAENTCLFSETFMMPLEVLTVPCIQRHSIHFCREKSNSFTPVTGFVQPCATFPLCDIGLVFAFLPRHSTVHSSSSSVVHRTTVSRNTSLTGNHYEQQLFPTNSWVGFSLDSPASGLAQS